MNDCQLYVKHKIEAYGLGFLMVSYAAEVDLAIHTTPITSLSSVLTIESPDLSLTYIPYMNGSDGVFFQLTDKATQSSKTIGFDVRYWQSFQESAKTTSNWNASQLGSGEETSK